MSYRRFIFMLTVHIITRERELGKHVNTAFECACLSVCPFVCFSGWKWDRMKLFHAAAPTKAFDSAVNGWTRHSEKFLRLQIFSVVVQNDAGIIGFSSSSEAENLIFLSQHAALRARLSDHESVPGQNSRSLEPFSTDYCCSHAGSGCFHIQSFGF